jgi:hypothetical protein
MISPLSRLWLGCGCCPAAVANALSLVMNNHSLHFSKNKNVKNA